MRLENVDNVIPIKDQVVVTVDPDITVDSEILGTDKSISMKFGTVVSMGTLANTDAGCPGLKKNDIAVFSEFAGYHIATNDDKLHKLIGGYSIMATTTNPKDIREETFTPINKRLLLEVQYINTDQHGLVLSDDESRDPRLEDLAYGKVIKLSDNSSDMFKLGDLVGYQPYAGETVRHRGSISEPELRVIMEDNILFVNK